LAKCLAVALNTANLTVATWWASGNGNADGGTVTVKVIYAYNVLLTVVAPLPSTFNMSSSATMFADAQARKFDLILFWSLDRLSREGVPATLAHLERLTAAGVEWRSFTEGYLDSTGPFKDAVIAIPAPFDPWNLAGPKDAARISPQKLQSGDQQLAFCDKLNPIQDQN
jgi:hypothetical protein